MTQSLRSNESHHLGVLEKKELVSNNLSAKLLEYEEHYTNLRMQAD